MSESMWLTEKLLSIEEEVQETRRLVEAIAKMMGAKMEPETLEVGND